MDLNDLTLAVSPVSGKIMLGKAHPYHRLADGRVVLEWEDEPKRVDFSSEVASAVIDHSKVFGDLRFASVSGVIYRIHVSAETIGDRG